MCPGPAVGRHTPGRPPAAVGPLWSPDPAISALRLSARDPPGRVRMLAIGLPGPDGMGYHRFVTMKSAQHDHDGPLDLGPAVIVLRRFHRHEAMKSAQHDHDGPLDLGPAVIVLR